MQLGIETLAGGQHVGRKEMLSGGEPARAAVLQADLHLAFQDEHPLRLARAVELTAEPDRAFAQLVPRSGQQRRQARFGGAFHERYALFAESRPAVVIGEQYDFRKGGVAVHYLLLLS